MVPICNNLFYKIIKNICPDEYIHHFSLFKNSIFSIIKIFKREITHNIFIDDELKNTITNIYVKAKKIHNTLNKFVFLYKIRKAIVFDYNQDLFGNPLETLEPLNATVQVPLLILSFILERLADITNISVSFVANALCPARP